MSECRDHSEYYNVTCSCGGKHYSNPDTCKTCGCNICYDCGRCHFDIIVVGE